MGRRSKQLRLKLAKRMWGVALIGFVTRSTRPGATVYTDDWGAYRKLKAEGRRHTAVSHKGSHRDWAKDLDGDGVREAHSNTMEGIWTGVRIFLAPFRGVSKVYLDQYAAMFEWAFNRKAATKDFLRAMLDKTRSTNRRT